MQLRKFRASDSATICSWIKDEKALYQWSADRINTFPLQPDFLANYYSARIECDCIIPLCACDENDLPIGHLFVRYPDCDDKSVVRFGFIIVDNNVRGQGYGRKTMQLAIDYARKVLEAKRITLAVFVNNESAKHCYEAAGFREVGQKSMCKTNIGEWESIEMELAL